MTDIEKEALNPDHPAYRTEARRGWGSYTRRVCVLSTIDPADGKRLLKRTMPGLSKEQHRAIGAGHAQLAANHRTQWSATADEAALETLGRPFLFEDYRISAIGREEFTDARKEQLRMHARRQSDHQRLALLHFMAAGHQLLTARRLCQASGL